MKPRQTGKATARWARWASTAGAVALSGCTVTRQVDPPMPTPPAAIVPFVMPKDRSFARPEQPPAAEVTPVGFPVPQAALRPAPKPLPAPTPVPAAEQP